MSVYYQDATLTLLLGDAVEQLRTLSDGSVDCVCTSPPYFGLRDYEAELALYRQSHPMPSFKSFLVTCRRPAESRAA